MMNYIITRFIVKTIMIVNANLSHASNGTIKWYVNNVYKPAFTSLQENIPLNKNDILKLEIIGANNTSIFQSIIPSITTTYSFNPSTKILNLDFSSSVFPNSSLSNTIIIKVSLKITQNSTTLNLVPQFNFGYSSSVDVNLSSYSFDFNAPFTIEYYATERYYTSAGFSEISSPQIFTYTVGL